MPFVHSLHDMPVLRVAQDLVVSVEPTPRKTRRTGNFPDNVNCQFTRQIAEARACVRIDLDRMGASVEAGVQLDTRILELILSAATVRVVEHILDNGEMVAMRTWGIPPVYTSTPLVVSFSAVIQTSSYYVLVRGTTYLLQFLRTVVLMVRPAFVQRQEDIPKKYRKPYGAVLPGYYCMTTGGYITVLLYCT